MKAIMNKSNVNNYVTTIIGFIFATLIGFIFAAGVYQIIDWIF